MIDAVLIGNGFGGSGRRLIEVHSDICQEGLRKLTKNVSRIAAIPGETRVEHFPNSSVARYHNAKPFRDNLLVQ